LTGNKRNRDEVENETDVQLTTRITNVNLSEDELMKIIFTAFDKKENLNLRQLQKFTDQPVANLRPILNKICDYVTSGRNRNTYELKPSFRPKKKHRT